MKRSPRTTRLSAGKRRAPPSSSPSPAGKAKREHTAASSVGINVAAPEPSRDAFPIVGIGASAGGLEAFSELLSHLPVEAPLALVFIQHLDPKHPSILTDILSRTTRIPVVEVTHGVRVEPRHVYVMPPNTRMTIANGVLNLAPRSDDRGPQMPIDHFLRSLAEDMRSRAIAVILSGSASDGALGLKAIKGEGGITFAEAPQSAKYDSMPRSAVASGAVDFVLPPKGIAHELTRIARHPYLGVADAPPSPAPLDVRPEAFDLILRMLREKSGVDFTQYRQTTIRRRIARRMMVHGVDTLDNYRLYLEAHPSQLQALHNDLLVNVTRFFRDSEAFRSLQASVFPGMVKRQQTDGPIRVWVPGCATGEEAYSLAIGLIESLGETANPSIQLFGTDVSEPAIVKARAGIYPENIELDVPAALLRRFFVKLDGQYQVRKAVRELCVFAKHNLATDPPFSKMDLVVCRNVLIYLEPELQKHVLSIFHYALNTPGFLMLGISETVGPLSDFFSVVDKKYRIYAKKPTSTRFDLGVSSLDRGTATRGRGKAARTVGAAGGRPLDLVQEADRILLSKYAPAGVLVNEAAEILQFRGRTSPYLEPAPGQASFNLLKMAREGLLMDLRMAIDKARKQNGPVRREGLSIKHDGKLTELTLHVIPVTGPAQERNYLVLFERVPSSEGPKARGRAALSAPLRSRRITIERQSESLRHELTATKEYLQSVIQDREGTNEELQAANEELQSSNEELQSTNEELETSKEELQSVNEELTTVNEELHHRNTEVSQVNNDLNNLLIGVSIPIVILGSDWRIRRFTPMAAKILNLIPADLGRPIGDIRPNVDLSDLESLCQHVIDSATVAEREVSDRNGRWYSLQVRPYTTADTQVDGVLITLEDVTVRRASVEQITAARNHAEMIVDTVPMPLVALDADQRVTWASRSFYETFQVMPEETTDCFLYDLGNGQWNIPALRKALVEVFEKNVAFHEFKVDHDFARIGAKTMLLNARPMHGGNKAKPMLLLAIDDITMLKKTEESLRTSG
ncbi:MAG: histidine kinase [Candidatus Rokuibacteriota bacterium]|nr:MAG: histidine kinase [Candidatus Rokubacteria bacterium]